MDLQSLMELNIGINMDNFIGMMIFPLSFIQMELQEWYQHGQYIEIPKGFLLSFSQNGTQYWYQYDKSILVSISI